MNSDERIKYAVRVLSEVRRRYRRDGLSWPLELESLTLLLANQRQGAPSVAADADLGDFLCVTYKEAARRLSVSERTINRLIAKGELPKVVIGDDCHRITVADLEAYAEGLRRERAA